MKYEPRTFDIPSLEGISEGAVREHIKLYEGYVKHVNLIHERIGAYSNDPDNNSYAIGEMQRRFGFEFDGMRNHEYYFSQLEGGARPLADGRLLEKLSAQWGGFAEWRERFLRIAMVRGIGWAMLYLDPHTDKLVQTWVDEHHLGQLAGLDVVFALDMWEHSYMLDYPPSRKKEYVEAFFRNVNWEVVARRVT
jgi:Fe-Mn family superoxide dismutase